MNNDYEAIVFALKTAAIHDIRQAKIVWIKNTLELDTIYVSEGLASVIEGIEQASLKAEPQEFQFDNNKKLLSWSAPSHP